MQQEQNKMKEFFKTPFSPLYWKSALSELSSPKTLIIAAMLIAVRVALKSAKIPVADGISVYITFIPNALLGFLCGPVVAFMSGIISDLLGCLLFPVGGYFFPFTLSEALGSFLYSVFLYRSRISMVRLFSCKLTVNLIINIIITPYLRSLMGGGKTMIAYMMTSVPKNLVLLPVETIILIAFFAAMLPVIKKLKVTKVSSTMVKFI